jgi:hypothetical protein
MKGRKAGKASLCDDRYAAGLNAMKSMAGPAWPPGYVHLVESGIVTTSSDSTQLQAALASTIALSTLFTWLSTMAESNSTRLDAVLPSTIVLWTLFTWLSPTVELDTTSRCVAFDHRFMDTIPWPLANVELDSPSSCVGFRP